MAVSAGGPSIGASGGRQSAWTFDSRSNPPTERVDLRLALQPAGQSAYTFGSRSRLPTERRHIRLALQPPAERIDPLPASQAAGKPAAVSRAHYFCCICCRRAVNPSTTSGSL
jgi:hypothetical protein